MKQFLLTVFLLTIPIAAQNTVTLEGQVVCCAECWAEADRTKVEFGTAEDLSKAKACTDNGDPTLLAVREGDKFVLYRLDQGKFKLAEKNWYSYVGKRVSVTGSKKRVKGAEAFVVDALTVTAPSIAEREATAALGSDAILKLKDPFGAEVDLAQYKGRIVVLNFWATWCAPCREEMPWLAAIQNDYAPLGVQVIGAAADSVADTAKVLQFSRQNKVNFPVWLGATTADMTRFGLGTVLPGTVVIDRAGKIAWQRPGIIKPAELRKALDAMLQAPAGETRPGKAAVAAKRDENASLVPA